MTTADPAPRLLLVLAHGIGPRELPRLHGDTAGLRSLPTAPLRLPDHPVGLVLGALDAVRELEDLGIGVDRSAVVLRPRGRTDATALACLTRRVTGPAEVTVLEAQDVLAQAIAGGPTAARAAEQQLSAQLERLTAHLRRGDPPEVWFVGLGAPVAVQVTFDFLTAWRRRVLVPLAHDLVLAGDAGTVTVRADNQRALELATAALHEPPFARHGHVRPLGNGRLQFTAAPSVAFARRRVTARAPLPHEANGVACAPLGDLLRVPDLDLAQLMARFWLRAAAQHGDVGEAPAPVTSTAPAESADVAAAISLLPSEGAKTPSPR